jgi:RNA polymerase sigma-70 factor (ECF subfamily)
MVTISPSNPGVLERIAAGEPDAVGQCLDQYGGLVWSLAKRFCSDPCDAEDAVQEVFTEIWTKADRYRPEIASESTYITMIARRRLIDMLRKRGRRPRHEALGEVQVSAPTEPSELETREEVDRVKRAINDLQPEQQRALKMAIYENCTHSRIAEELNLPLGTVKTNIRRGLQRVRNALKETENPGGPQG